jgi:hypothetical protein
MQKHPKHLISYQALPTPSHLFPNYALETIVFSFKNLCGIYGISVFNSFIFILKITTEVTSLTNKPKRIINTFQLFVPVLRPKTYP